MIFVSSIWNEVHATAKERNRRRTVSVFRFAQPSVGNYEGGVSNPVSEAQSAIIRATIDCFFDNLPSEFLDKLQAGASEIVAGNSQTDLVVLNLLGELEQIAPANGNYERLELCVETATSLAQNYNFWQRGLDLDVFAEWPAGELVAVRQLEESIDWKKRWLEAGGKIFGDGRMVAPISSPIWTALSFFGLPFAPFDIGSGMGIREMNTAEATQLGCEIEYIQFEGLDFNVAALRERIDAYFQRNPPIGG